LPTRRKGQGPRLERLVPAHFDELAVTTDQWAGQSVGVAVEFAEAGSLRADEAGAEDVIAVAAGRGHPRGFVVDLEVSPQVASQNGQMRNAGRVIPSSCAYCSSS